jgi:cystathionine beta-lyase
MTLITRTLPVDDIQSLRQRRSAKWRMYPPDVLPLAIAEMDFPLATPIRKVLHDAVARSDTGYAVDVPELSNAISRFAIERWDWMVDPGCVVATTDAGVASAELLRLLSRPGDTVVVNPPVYASFFEWVTEAGARLMEVPLTKDPAGCWRLDLDALRDAFRQRPAVYLLCNPHNPVGCLHDFAELSVVVNLAHEYGVRIISDEVHGPLVLNGGTFIPLLTVPGAGEVAFSVMSASKAWNLAGLKCAAIVSGSPAMERIVRALPSDRRWRVGHFGVLAAVAAFTSGGTWLDSLVATLEMRCRELSDLLTEYLPEIRWQPPQATFLAWLDCQALGDGTFPYDLFLGRGRVALGAGPQFGTLGSGYVRLNFGTSAEVLAEGVRRMAFAVRGFSR